MNVFSFTFCFLLFSGVSGALYGQSLNEYNVAIAEAQQEKDTLALARGWYKLGVFFDNQQNLHQSNVSLLKALYWAESINSSKAIASIANYLASNYSIIAQSDSSIHYYQIALKASVAYGDSTRLPIVLINLGDEYANSGEYLKAANYVISAIRIKEQIKDSTNLAYFYQNVGEVYKVAGENEKWEEYISKAYQLIRNKNYTSISANVAIYNDLGGLAEIHEEYEQALLYYDTVVTIAKQHDYEYAIGVALNNSATIYKEQGDIDKALEVAAEAQRYTLQQGYHILTNNNLMAELLLEKGNYKDALEYALIAVNHKVIDDNPEEKIRAFKNLYFIEKGRKNYEQALKWNENFKQLSDSLRNKEVRTQIVDLEIKYQTEKKEQTIELLTTENRLKNQRLNAGVAIMAFLIVVIFLTLYILRIRKKQAQLKQTDLQQQVLRAQMNPHFIFNVLGSIQNFMMQNDTRKASNYLSQFATLTRATLNNSTAETISLADEIDMLRNYIQLEKMRSKNKFDFAIEYHDDLEADFIKIPPMLIQPFVENSIKHGFRNIEKGGFLKLRINDKADWIEFIVEDNGQGIQQKLNENKEHKSMAMLIFEKRRKLIEQKYNKDFKFEMQNLKDSDPSLSGVKTSINIPILNND